jgi:hypothetical protein
MDYYNEAVTRQNTARERYEKLKADRQQFLDRARECSELTIPSLIPDEGFNYSSDLYSPFQSVGARGVNNLASKLLLLLLPPNSPFFRLQVSGDAKKEMEERTELKTEVEKSLADIEREVSKKIEELALRVSVFEALKHLIVGGNVLTYLPKNKTMRVYPLSQYVCRRDPQGELIEIIIKESIAHVALDDEIKQQMQVNGDYKDDDNCDIYTHIYKLDNKKFYVCQEVMGIKIPSTIGTIMADAMPYQALRMVRIDNENYGRSFVEEFLGDLKSLEGLSQSLVESAAASSKVVFMVKPNAVTRKRDLAQTRNGDIITGSEGDVAVLQANKQYDLQVVERSIQKLEERMSYAFLLHTAIQRDAERVTIITGIEALGRGNDLQKLREFVAEIGQLAQINPQVVQALNPNDLITRIATGLGIDTEGLIKTPEQLQAEQEQVMEQQQMQQAMDTAQQVAPQVVNNMTKEMGN